MKTSLTAADVIRLLNLKPLTIEGGFFSETYRSDDTVALPRYAGTRSLATAIYYLLTPETFSEIHRVPGEEIFHFYLGDPVEMLQLAPESTGEVITLGHEIDAGMKVQHVVPGGYWQGTRLKPGGAFALLGTTMSPGFDYADYESGKRAELEAGWPQWKEMIGALCRK